MSIKGSGACQSLVKLCRTKNGLSKKLNFSLPCCSILIIDSEYMSCVTEAASSPCKLT